MAHATFVKDMPVENDVRQDGADPRDEPKYQMVPVGGSRKWRIEISKGPIKVATLNDKIAGVAALADEGPLRAVSYTSSGDLFIIGGPSSGNTVVVAEDEQGNRQDIIQVRVKARKNVTYNVLRLGDAIRNPSITIQEVRILMPFVETLYLSATNTIFVKKTEDDLLIKRNLSDKNNVIQLDEDDDNKEALIFDAIMNQKLGSVDIVYVFTWELQGASTLRQTGFALDGRCETANERFRKGPTIIYINAFGVARKEITLAHETGHHFGLSHFNLRPAGFLMNSGGQTGFRLIGEDIELVNRS